MEFRLTYAGPLRATQRDSTPGQPSRHMGNKHNIRTVFHRQLKELWRIMPALNGEEAKKRPDRVVVSRNADFKPPLTNPTELAERHAHHGFAFVPLVTQEMDLLCSLDIMFLRPDRPGSLIWAGDIDNRLKTLLDALRIPEAAENYASKAPTQETTPFFCLLEEDKLVTRVAVETDRLLEPVGGDDPAHEVRLMITVKLKPYELNNYNMHFG